MHHSTKRITISSFVEKNLQELSFILTDPRQHSMQILISRATTDMLIGSVSQVALNHIGLLIVDEIQNVVNSKNGKSLVGALTQLINNVCEKNKELLEQKNILLRRFYKAEVSLYADKTMLEKAISILLDTAIINSLEKQDISIYTKQHNESISFSLISETILENS